jgi:hypothetical protein
VALLPEVTLWEAGVEVTVKSEVGAGAAPVPVRELICVPTVSVTDKVSAKLPVLLGENVTAVVQELPAASDDPQVFVVIAKLPAAAPLRAMELIGSAALPAFVSINVWAALVLPDVTLPKVAVAGVRVAWGAAAVVAVPVRAAVCVPTASVTVSVAVKVPADVGVKLTAIVQEAPAAREAPQELAPCRKLGLLAPLMPNEVMESVAFPALVRVKVVGALVAPTVTVPKLPVPGVSAACAADACAPAPVRVAVWVPASSVTVKVVVSAPVAVGLKTTV